MSSTLPNSNFKLTACPKAVIVFVTSAEDVSTTLVLCQKYKVETVVSGGKHSSGGASSTTGGLVIDLAEMRKVAVNAESKTLTVQGGAVWKDVDEAAANYGLATVGGTVNHTGVGGLTLGGGYGWLSGRYGLAIDNLLRATIVLADGRIITASETLHPDLFWAVRGAGQCFGVVVEFVFQAFDQVEPVWAGQMVYLAHKSLDSLVQFANSFVERNDPDAGLVLGITAPPMLKELALVASVFYNGPEEKAKAIFEPLIKIGPIVNNVRVRPYVEVNGLLNHAVPYGGSKLSKGASFIAPLSPAFMRTVIAGLEALHTEIPETKKSILNLEFYSPDQWCRVPLTATAFANRGRHQNALIGPFWSDRKDDIAVRLWARHMAGVFVAELNRVQKESRDPKQMSIVTEYGNYDCMFPDAGCFVSSNCKKLLADLT